jgi:2'-5' RNA ligase
MRLFVAIELSGELRERAAALVRRLAASGAPVNWVAPENVHLTLKFLGEVPEARLSEIEAACARAAAATAPFAMRLRGTGAFPHAREPRVIWAGVEAPAALANLAARIEEELVPLGFPREKRPFEPHVTLGRKKEKPPRRPPRPGREPARPGPDLTAALAKEAGFDGGEVEVRRFSLVQSQLRREGPIYTTLKEFGLGPR